MSYILEALKKSESERGNSGTPTFQTVHTSSLQYQQRPNRVWPVLLAVIVLMNMAVLGWLVYDKVGPQQADVASAAPTPPADTLAPQPASTSVAEPVIDVPARPAALDTETPKTVTAPLSRQEPVNLEERYEVVLEQVPQPTLREPIENTRSPVRDIYDLPADIQASIPELTFSAHVYSSNPLQRSVVINGDFMEQGDMLTSELRLEEITADGVIMDYRGTRFRSSVVSGWNIN